MSLVELTKVPGGEFHVYSQKPDIDFSKVKQVHGNLVETCTSKNKNIIEDIEADGILWKDGEQVENLCIVTADCLPIYIFGDEGKAMLHAGWKGLHQEIILTDPIKTLKPTFAYIGPHICQDHYQVGSEFSQYFSDSDCLKPDKAEDGKFLLSLKKEACFQLKKLNPEIEIKWSEFCTFESDSLHSYRRNSTTMRNWNVFINRV